MIAPGGALQGGGPVSTVGAMEHRERLAVGQGLFYLASGIWPILHLRSFEAVTGPKPEGWLVKTVGALVAVAGGALLFAGLRQRITPEIAGLALGSAASLAAIDLTYAGRRRISPVYFGDAAVEIALAGGWLALLSRTERKTSVGIPA